MSVEASVLLDPRRKARLARRLRAWYRKHRRDLPWRRTRDPYRIWVSEIMLQQTQVATVIPYYKRFLAAFPTVRRLARAPEQRVLKLWEGLGYYARARSLHRAARRILEQHRGRFPRTWEDLAALPGVGPSTAGAILSIALDQPYPILDGNAKRVLCRLFGVDGDPGRAETQRRLWSLSRALLPRTRAGEFNQALMELGATLCTPKRPQCFRCPWEACCTAHSQGLEESLPRRGKSRSLPHRCFVHGIVWKGDRLLLTQRPREGLLGGLWEFPGAGLRDGGSREEALRSALREHWGLEVARVEFLGSVRHTYSHMRATLYVYRCTHREGPTRRDSWAWIRPEGLGDYPLPVAHHKIVRLLRPFSLAAG